MLLVCRTAIGMWGYTIGVWERFESVGMLLACGTGFVYGNAFSVWEYFYCTGMLLVCGNVLVCECLANALGVWERF
jgi:hypothetical protein